VTFLALSGANTYRVRPCALTSTAPSPGRVRVEIPTVAVAAVLDVPEAAGVDADDLVGVVLELPQPTASIATADPSSLTTGFLTGTSFALPVLWTT
jgi:hypothetical protein